MFTLYNLDNSKKTNIQHDIFWYSEIQNERKNTLLCEISLSRYSSIGYGYG
jgi:hypothetical protein